MNNEIMPFNFDGNDVRVIIIDGDPWFVGADVARTLGYGNSTDALNRHVDEDDRMNTVAFHDSITRGNPHTTIINESGLYALVFGSKLPAAKKFKRWITSEVIPTIRKTGSYSSLSGLSPDELELQRIEEYRQAVLERMRVRAELELAAPKATRYDMLIREDGGYNRTSVGRALGFDRRQAEFTEHLLNLGGLEYNRSGRTVPTEEWIEEGWMIQRGTHTAVITEAGLKHLESLDLR